MLTNKINLISNKRIVCVIAIVTACVLLPLLWFSRGLPILHSASYLPIDPQDDLQQMCYAWNSQTSLGLPTKDFVKIPYVALFAFFHSLGLSLLSIQRIVFMMNYILTGLSMFFLASVISNRKDYIVPLVSSTFYLLNLYVAAKIPYLMVYASYWVLPLAVGLYLRYLQENSNKILILLALSVVSLFAAPVMGNPPHFAAMIIVLGMLFVWIASVKIREKTFSRKTLVKLVIPIIVFVLISSWWILPFCNNVFFGLGKYEISHQVENLSKLPSGQFSKMTSFANLFRLFGHWALESDHQGDLYYPFIKFYQNRLLVFVGFLLSALALTGLLTKKACKYSLFFALLLLIALFITKGRHQPLAFINDFMYTHIPFFWVMRNQWQKMMPVIIMCFSILMGIGVSFLVERISVRSRSKIAARVFLAAVIVVIVIQGWPLISSQHFAYKTGRKYLTDDYVDIPNYWFEVSEWIESRTSDGRIILLPPNRFSAAAFEYRWGYVGISLSNLLIQRPLISADKKMSGSIQQNTSSKVTNPLFFYFLRNGRPIPELYYKIFDIEYILQRNDFNLTFRNKTFRIEVPGYAKEFLKGSHNLELKKQFGELDVYQYKNDN